MAKAKWTSDSPIHKSQKCLPKAECTPPGVCLQLKFLLIQRCIKGGRDPPLCSRIAAAGAVWGGCRHRTLKREMISQYTLRKVKLIRGLNFWSMKRRRVSRFVDTLAAALPRTQRCRGVGIAALGKVRAPGKRGSLDSSGL